jgi:hypothetical protein
MSGTTAITVLIRGRSVLVANVGDSRTVLGEKRSDGSGYLAKDLSIDQTPYRCAWGCAEWGGGVLRGVPGCGRWGGWGWVGGGSSQPGAKL